MAEVTFKAFDMVRGSALITDPEAADEIACTLGPLFTPRPIAEYHEDMGTVLWWKFPIEEPPYVGSPNCLGYEVRVDCEIRTSNPGRNGKRRDGARVATLPATRRFHVGGWIDGYYTHFTPIPLPREPKPSEPA